MAYERADALLEEQKPKWKAGGVGGVLLLSKQVAAKLSVVPTLVAQLQSPSCSADAKAKAADELWNLAINADNKVAIAKEPGALAALVALLHEGSEVGKKKAAGALHQLAFNADNHEAIAKAGALVALVALVRDGQGSAAGSSFANKNSEEMAAAALGNLAVSAKNKVRIVEVEGALNRLWWRCCARGARSARITRRTRCGAWQAAPTTRRPSPRNRARWRRWWRCCATKVGWARRRRSR